MLLLHCRNFAIHFKLAVFPREFCKLCVCVCVQLPHLAWPPTLPAKELAFSPQAVEEEPHFDAPPQLSSAPPPPVVPLSPCPRPSHRPDARGFFPEVASHSLWTLSQSRWVQRMLGKKDKERLEVNSDLFHLVTAINLSLGPGNAPSTYGH